MTVALITPPALEPVTLAEVKDHLRITDDAEDGYLGDLIQAARVHVEQTCGRKLITQTWRRYVGGLPRDRAVDLHLGPVRNVEAVTLYDADGVPSQAIAEDYRLIDDTLLLDRVPSVAARNGIEIDVVCGYGDIPPEVPSTLRRAILLLIAHWHEFRGAVAPRDQPVSLPPGFAALVHPYRRVNL